MLRQVEFGWRQVEADRFLDILAGFRLGITGRSAAR
jgi:ribosome modulation factor